MNIFWKMYNFIFIYCGFRFWKKAFKIGLTCVREDSPVVKNTVTKNILGN